MLGGNGCLRVLLMRCCWKRRCIYVRWPWGDTRGLSQQDWEVLRATGLTHLIAISGFHVGMVAGACALLVSLLWRVFPHLAWRWPRPIAMALIAVPAAAGYTVLAGASLPTVRTALMIGIVALARLTRRRAMPGHVLGLACLSYLFGIH